MDNDDENDDSEQATLKKLSDETKVEISQNDDSKKLKRKLCDETLSDEAHKVEEISQNDDSEQELKKLKRKDDSEQELKKLKRKLSDETQKESDQFFNWSSSSCEQEFVGFVIPGVICLGNLVPHITEDNIKEFFINVGEPYDVTLKKPSADGMMTALVGFEETEEASDALKLSGEDLLGSPVYITLCPNGNFTLCATGFDPQLSLKQLRKVVRKSLPWDIAAYFLAKSSSTGSNLGFCYFLVTPTEEEEYWTEKTILHYLEETEIYFGEFKVDICKVKLKPWVVQSIWNNDGVLQIKVDAFKKSIEENMQRQPAYVEEQEPISWRRTHPELFTLYLQSVDDCWAVVLFRSHRSAFQFAYSRNSDLTLEMIKTGVHPKHLLSGKGIDNIKDARSFMLSLPHVTDLKFHHRPPKTEDEAQFEEFEKKIINLLKKGPIGVQIKCLPSYLKWNRQGIFVPTVIDLIRSRLEDYPFHGLYLSGHDSEAGVDYWDLQDSSGEIFGDGFLKLGRHYRLLKQIFEFVMV